MNNADRRQWKLAVIKALSADGFQVATIRRTIGSRSFNALLEQAYRSAPDPVHGAKIARAKLQEKHGAVLERPVTPWSRE